MLRSAFLHYTYVEAGCTALFMFLIVFAGVLFWVYRKGASDVYQYAAELPLKGDQIEGTRHE